MSVAAFSYGKLKDAAGDAKQVARKCDAYADAIQRAVCNKLNQYNGTWSGDLRTCKQKAEEKIESLRETASQYQSLSNGLSELREACRKTDRAVRSEVSSLTASFKAAHNIRDNAVVNFLGFMFTKFGNSSATGRWLNAQFSKINASADDLRLKIKTWYDYKGGKALLNGIFEATAGILLALAAVFTGGPLVVTIAALVYAAIAIADGVTDAVHEGMAYYLTNRGDWNQDLQNDPALARRMSGINTFADCLRKESDSKALHNAASALDITAFTCAAITLTYGMKDLVGRGLKWANNTSSLSFRDYFSKSNWGNFLKEAKTSLRGGAASAWNDIKDIFRAMKTGDFTRLNQAVRITAVSLRDNFKEFYKFDFSDRNATGESLKKLGGLMEGAGSMFGSNSALGALTHISVAVFAFPALNDVAVFHPYELHIEQSGQVAINMEPVKLEDFFDRWDELTDDGLGRLFQGHHELNWKLRRKLSEPSTVSVAVPALNMPDLSKIRNLLQNSPDFSDLAFLSSLSVPAFRLERVGWPY